jgi:two-component system, sensor histidine kinase and response regulator
MPAAPLPANEAARLKALHDLDVLDSPSEAEFDALVNVASLVCGVPYSLISLVDADRQWFKANKGLDGVSETPRSFAFCAHAILGGGVMEVPDATRDPRFSDNALVNGAPDIRFYAGAPVVLTDGSHVGTLCVIDDQPRQLDATQRQILQSLAVAAARALEGRKAIRTQNKIMRALHKNEMLLDRTGAMAQVGGWEIDLATSRIFWSKETRRIHGVPDDYVPVMEEAINFYAPQARPVIQAAVEEGMTSGKGWDLELPFIRLDGTPIWVRAVGMVEFEDGQPVRMVGAFQDVTERRNADTESLKNAQLLRNAIDIIDEAFVVYDPQDRLVHFNEKYKEIYPASAEAIVLGNTFENIIRYGAERGHYPAAVGRVDAWVAERLLAHQASNTTQLQRLDDGRTLRIVERKLPDGHIVGFRIDITDLMRATEAAQQASDAKSQFLANMSHEIRTPMNAIIGMSHLALKTDMTPRQRDYITKVHSSGKHLLGIVNDILDFSKVESGKLTIEHIDFEMDKLLQNVAYLISEKCSVKGVELIFDIAPDVPQNLIGDPLRVSQILINYANNAVKYTERGEIVISARVSDRTPHDALLRFSVRDSGIGLTGEQMTRLFKSFSQADSSTTRKFGGTGLGLAISKNLSGLMGGEAGVNSIYGKGSNFWFTVRVGISQTPKRVLMPVPDLRGRRALVVEHNEHARIVMREMLESMTFEVTDVAAGAEALVAVRRAHATDRAFDIIYLDWRMPLMDGIETARQIRALGHTPEATLVLVSAYSGEELIKDARFVGIANVLVKPLSHSVLFDATMQALGEHRTDSKSSVSALVDDTRPLASVRGARILVVDDNDINLLIARELLEDAGLVVDVAVNGQIALDMVQKIPYSMVLMDMQMPVMDGVQATRAIRLVPGLATLSIVAMTANARQEDRLSCLAAGMNDFLSKPIDPDMLWSMLLKWVKPLRTVSPALLPIVPPSNATENLPQGIDGLEVAKGLGNMMGKKPLYVTMLRKYLTGQQSCVQNIQDALDAGDTTSAQRMAHTLKGVSATIGATAIAGYASSIEGALREQLPRADADTALHALQMPMEKFVSELQAWLSTVPVTHQASK